jgi:lipopolysaccharide biosynthesis regulator YciM
LINEQTDQAVEHFLKMVRVDSTTIETHFALGNLFRKRGEVNRAIRIHQNIIARPDISDEQRDQAFYSLAKDYLHAGLLDRAEVLFRRLSEGSLFRTESLYSLTNIYETEGEWEKCINCSKILAKVTKKSFDLHISHYLCELADLTLANGNVTKSIEFINTAKKLKTLTLRADLVEAKCEILRKNHISAMKIYKNIIQTSTYLITEALPELVSLHKQLGNLEEFDKFIKQITMSNKKLSRDIGYTVIINNINDVPSLDNCLNSYIENDNTLREFLGISYDDQDKLKNEIISLDKIKHGLFNLARTTPRYQCESCGFSSQNLLWLCPSCKQWETQRPFSNVQFDSILQRMPLISD